MKKSRVVSLPFLLIFLFIFLLTHSFAQEAAGEKPIWIKYWEEWVQKTGNKEWQKWLDDISSPEAIKLGKEWADYLGYDAVSIILKSKKAPDIKPGLVITSKNYKDYPGLKELLPEPLYNRLKEGSYAQFPEMRIVPTTHYYYSKGKLEITKKYEGKYKLDANGMLKDWKGGIPFPHPKNGLELAWDFDRTSIGADDLYFEPIDFLLFDKNGKLERTLKMNIYWQNSIGRDTREPIPSIPGLEDHYERGSIVFFYPFDIKGFAAVRHRYKDPEKPDYFITWVPSLRRTRLFSGTDSQDPMFGSDIPWDDWKAWWQKISHKIYPNEFKLLGETEILCAVQRNYPVKIVGNKLYVEWERYPVYLLEVKSKDPSYMYSKKLMWIEKETFRVRYMQNYDRRGNLWRDWLSFKHFDPKTGGWTWNGVDVVDLINKHRTLVRMQSIPNDPRVNNDLFNLRILSRMAR